MLKIVIAGVLTFGLAESALAQTSCEAVLPASIPACMVGAWYGSSDATEKFQSILDSIPSEEMRARVSGSMGQDLAIGIYSDGYYATWPTGGSLDGEMRSGDEGMVFGMDLEISPSLGWMSVSGSGKLQFCTVSGGGVLTTQTQGMHGETADTFTMSALPSGFDADIDVLCEGGTLQMLMNLPAPIGTVTYTLHRLPASRMTDDFRRLYDRRFADE